jgi:hypothetical protein
VTIDAATPSTGGADDVRATAPDAAPDDAPPEQTTPDTVTEARVPVADVTRDVVAAVALLAALALPWSFGTHAADHVEAVLSTVVALLVLPLPYLARAGALPKGWTVSTTRTVRLWAALPFVVVAVVYIVLDLVNGAHPLQTHGVGTGLGLGLAGALLAAQPRRSELGPVDEDRAAPGLWRGVLAVLGAVVAVGAVVALVIFFVDAPSVSGDDVFLALCVTLATFALGVLPAWGAFSKDEAWRTVLVGVGSALGILFLVGSGGLRGLLTVESLHGLRFGLVLVPAQAAVVAGAAFARSLRAAPGYAEREDAALDDSGSDDAASEVSASEVSASDVSVSGDTVSGDTVVLVSRAVVTRTLLVLWITAALVAISSAFSMAEGARGGAVVVSLVATGLVAVLAGLTWFRVRSGASGVDGAALAALVTVSSVVIGTVAVVVDSRERAGVPIDVAMVAYGLPAILAVALASAAGRAWWSQTRATAAASSAAYVWAPRPRATPRVALTPVAVPARPSRPVDDEKASVEPASERAPLTQPAAEAAATERPQPEPVATSSTPTAGEPRKNDVIDKVDEVDEQTVVRRSWESVPRESVPSAAPTAPVSSDDLGATAVLQPVRPDPVVAEAGFTADQASDPSTSLEDLAKIAEHAPSLRPYVASNPSTYSALLEWLGGLGDPAVDRALDARPDRRR